MQFTWAHKLAEDWIAEASKRCLSDWKRALLLWHLQRCATCRSLGLSLAEFLYGFDGRPRPSAHQREWLHLQVMESFRRNRGTRLEIPSFQPWQGLFVRPSFAIALAASLLLVAGLFYFSVPVRRQDSPGLAQPKLEGPVAFSTPTASVPLPSPTPTLASQPNR